MAYPVVHFEIIGSDPDALRRFYAAVFDWQAPPGAPVASEVSDAAAYSFLDTISTPDGIGVPGGIGGGPGRSPRATFYVGVPNVEQALLAAEAAGGRRILGPVRNEAGAVVVGHFIDPGGNLIGVAGPA